jgi:hypothetical protein
MHELANGEFFADGGRNRICEYRRVAHRKGIVRGDGRKSIVGSGNHFGAKMKGPNYSHYHRNGSSTHYRPHPKNYDPGFSP